MVFLLILIAVLVGGLTFLFARPRQPTAVNVPRVDGKPMECLVCGNTTFTQRTALLNTAGLTFMKLDWANRQATCVVCDRCGFVHWFAL